MRQALGENREVRAVLARAPFMHLDDAESGGFERLGELMP